MNKRFKTVSLVLLVAAMCGGAAFAETAPIETIEIVQQNGACSGTVTDAMGNALTGASVLVRGTSKGAVVDANGRFNLTGVKNGATLRISYIGYETAEVKWQGQPLTIVLAENENALDEAVVIGYGTQKKVNVIGSIASVDSKDLDSRSGGDVTNMLTGQLSGVTITQSSGNPGDDAGTIRVRGVGSFGASPEPLVLIDGMPGSLSDLTSGEVESISVLKDAASAAIYGSRAANGVVLVTTKRGKEGRTKVNYNGSVGMSQAVALPELAHSYEYAEYFNMAMGIKTFTDDQIAKMKNGTDRENYADEMYLEDLMGGHAVQTKHEVSVNGGAGRTRYNASFGYFHSDGLLPSNYFNRYNGRLNLSTDITSKLKLNVNLSGRLGDRHEPSSPGSMDNTRHWVIVSNALRFPGMYPTYMDNGEIGLGPKLQGTPVAWANCNSYFAAGRDRFNTSVDLAYTPVKGLTFKAIGGYNYTQGHSRSYRTDMVLTGGKHTGPSMLDESMNRTAYKTFQGLATYDNTFGGKHTFNALLGYTWEDESQRTLGGYRTNFPSDDVPYLNAGGADGQTNNGGGYDWAMMSFFGRVGYNYMQRYLVEATARYDGSSRFPTDSKFGFFPSVAVGWRVSEEAFWKNNPNLAFWDALKVKASMGVLGNNNIGNYPYQSVYTLSSNMNYVFGGTYTQGAGITTYVDPKLKWERTRTTDVGIETAFFNSRLTFNATYYNRTTTDVLYKPSASYSSIFGLGVSQVNTGELTNKGVEIELGHKNRVGKFNYHIAANFTYNKNEVVTLGLGNVEQTNGMIGNGSDLFIGCPMQMFYGYKTDGVFLTDDEVSQWPDQSKIAKGSVAGDIRYVDLNDDGVVDEKDKAYLGSRIPKYNFGLNLGFDIKGFDFNMLVQGVAGVQGMLSVYAGYAFYQEGNIQKWQMDGCWNVQQDNRYPEYPRLEVMSNAGSNNTLTSDWWVRNASFVKVRNIQMGYTLPEKVTNKAGIERLRFYLTLDNPLAFHGYYKGWDPETTSNNGQYYPTMSTYTFGISVNF